MSQPSAFEQVCFIAFFATLPLYSPNMIFSPDLAGFDLAMPYFVHSTLATAMVAGMAAACIALCAKEPSRITFLTPLRMTIVALLYLTGLFLLFASLLLPGVPVELCSLLGGTLCGTTTLLLCIAWGSVFSTLTFREALIRLSVLLAICALINTGFVYMGSETGVASFLLLSILGLVPLLIRSTHGEFVRLLNVQRDAKSQDSTVFHSFFSVALGPFVGFLLFALTMAVRKIAVFGNMYAESIGTILAVVSVLPLWLRKSDKPLLPFVFQIYLPIFAAILLFLSSFPTGHAVHSIGMIGIYVFFGAIGVLALASFCAIAHAQEFSVPLIFGSSISFLLGFDHRLAFRRSCGHQRERGSSIACAFHPVLHLVGSGAQYTLVENNVPPFAAGEQAEPAVGLGNMLQSGCRQGRPVETRERGAPVPRARLLPRLRRKEDVLVRLHRPLPYQEHLQKAGHPLARGPSAAYRKRERAVFDDGFLKPETRRPSSFAPANRRTP